MQNIFHGKTTKCRFAHIIAILAGTMLAFSGDALAQQQQARPVNAAAPAKSPTTANTAGAKPPAAANAAAASQPAAQAAKSRQSSAQKQNEPPRPAGRFVVRGENFSKNRFAREQEPKTDNHLQGPFYFVDENPMQVIKILEELTGQVAITSSGLPNAKINFASKGKLPRDEAILAIKSLLTANGMAVVQMGEKFFKVSPSQGVNAQAPTYISGKASDLPTSNAFASKFYELKYVDIETLAQTLSTFISPNNVASLSLFPRSNAFFLTDTVANHQRIEMLLEKIDVEPSINEEIGFFMLKNVGADDAKRKISTIQNDALKKYLAKTSIESDERTNQLIVVTPKGNLKHIRPAIDAQRSILYTPR